jgi:hypothetical protein
VQIPALRLLSAGNLSGFTETTKFDENGDFLENHLKRRQALMYNVLNKEGAALNVRYDDDDVPPRRK